MKIGKLQKRLKSYPPVCKVFTKNVIHKLIVWNCGISFDFNEIVVRIEFKLFVGKWTLVAHVSVYDEL